MDSHLIPRQLTGLLGAIKGLTLANVLVIALLALILIPVYASYRMLNDEHMMDRITSSYHETSSQQVGCVLRHARESGGPDQWSVAAGFANQGADRWYVAVWLDHEPNNNEVITYCEALKLIADKMLAPNEQ